MSTSSNKVIPDQWNHFDWIGLSGVVMVLGATDVGKTTFSHFLFRQIKNRGGLVAAILDGDPG